MAGIIDFTNAFFDSVNTTSSIVNDYTSQQAKQSTRVKQVKLQSDIDDRLNEIKRSSKFENWQDDMNTFFEQVKAGMSDENSPYYCKNNLQADMFTEILDQSQLGVSQKVNEMVYTAERDKAIVDYNDSVTRLKKLKTGQAYIDEADELAKGLFDSGYITRQQYQNLKEDNYTNAYIDLASKMFDGTVIENIMRGDSEDKIVSMIFENMPDLIGTDTEGLAISRDNQALKDQVEKSFRQKYRAKLSDIQQENVDKLAGVLQSMRQAKTAEQQLALAEQGQLMMNRMPGNMLKTNDREAYSAYFQIKLDGSGLGKGSGSGSGSSKPTDSFKTFFEKSPETCIQWVKDGLFDNYYDAAKAMSEELYYNWKNVEWKENYGKDDSQREYEYNMVYKAQTSEDTLNDAIISELKKKYKSAAMYLDKDYKNLIADMKKNSDKYGDAAPAELSYWVIDRLLGADGNYTDEQFVQDLNDHINNCYVEKCKYVELDRNNKPRKTFNASDPAQVAQAAKFANTKDYVFNYNGHEYWPAGKREAFEAEGGVVNVLENAVRSTLDIPDGEKINYAYKNDEQHNDVTSTPIFYHGGNAYEVVPSEDESGFMLRVIHPGVQTVEQNGKMYEVYKDGNGREQLKPAEYIEGKVKDYKGERADQRKELKAQQKKEHDERVAFEDQRNEALKEKIQASNEIPKAMKNASHVTEHEWGQNKESREIYLHDTESGIISAAKQVEKRLKKGKGGMSPAEFTEKFGIKYSDWIEAEGVTERYELILNSK